MALDFSTTKRVFLTYDAPVYKKLDTKLERQNESELKALDENLKPQELSDRVKDAEKNLQTIYFRDPLNQKITQSALSGESISRLKEFFGDGDFYTRKDGSLILNGKAENFVSGWYGDIAYTREYLKADKNHDGFMDKAELDETKSGFTGHGFFIHRGDKILYYQEDYIESYIKLNGYALSSDGFTLEYFPKFRESLYKEGKFAAPTLALELDKTLKNDKNLDGIITNREILTPNEMIQGSKEMIQYVLTYAKGHGKVYTLLDLMLRDEKNLNLMNKLAQNDFDISKLDEEELKEFKENFSFLFDKDTFNKEKAKEFYEGLEKEFNQKNEEIFKTSKEDKVEDKKDNFKNSSDDTIELKQNNEKSIKQDLNLKDLSPVLQDLAKNSPNVTQSLNLELKI